MSSASAKRRVSWIVFGVLFVFASILFWSRPVASMILGVVLVALSIAISIRHRLAFVPDIKHLLQGEIFSLGETPVSNLPVTLPREWNEREITFVIEKYRSSDLMAAFIEHLFSRFIIGQETRTARRRIEFLQQFNKYAEVARETLAWERTMKKGGRAEKEEDAKDISAAVEVAKKRAELSRAEGELEQIGLENEAKRLAKKLEIAQLNKQIADLDKPLEAPPVPKKRTINDVETDIVGAYADDNQIKANPAITPDDKMRRLNINERRREKLFEELERLKAPK